MNKNNIKIIDKTITVLWDMYNIKILDNQSELISLIKLIHLVCNACIEIPIEIYKCIAPLPNNIKSIKRNEKIIKINNSKDIDNIKNLKFDRFHSIRIEGLDDVILYSYTDIFSKLINKFGNNIEMSISDNYNCGTAMTLEWIKAGGNKVVTTFNGIGCYTPLEEVLCSLKFIENINMKGNYELFPKLSEIFENFTNKKIDSNKAIIGEKIFDVESGIHANGILKNPETFEPYNPSLIGRERNIILGKYSGTKIVEMKLNELNIPYKNNNLIKILDQVRIASYEKRRGLNNNEISLICERMYD